MLTRTSSQSLTDQLAERFATRIRDRLLLPGARLPSVRECARQQDVSPYTVVAAYDQLLAQGLVEARKQRGFFVRDIASNRPLAPVLHTQEAIKKEAKGRAAVLGDEVLGSGSQINATALIRGMFHQASSKPQPGAGVFPPDWLETSFMAAAVRRATSGMLLHDHSLKYGDPMGDPALREVLAHRLAAIHIPVTTRQIITTVGAPRSSVRATRPMVVTLTWVRSWISRYGTPFSNSGTTRQRSDMASSSAGVHRSSRKARTSCACPSAASASDSACSGPEADSGSSWGRRFMING